jgi:hypothetical protein
MPCITFGTNPRYRGTHGNESHALSLCMLSFTEHANFHKTASNNLRYGENPQSFASPAPTTRKAFDRETGNIAGQKTMRIPDALAACTTTQIPKNMGRRDACARQKRRQADLSSARYPRAAPAAGRGSARGTAPGPVRHARPRPPGRRGTDLGSMCPARRPMHNMRGPWLEKFPKQAGPCILCVGRGWKRSRSQPAHA